MLQERFMKNENKIQRLSKFYGHLLARAFERSRRNAKGISACSTVAGRTNIRGRVYQVQVVVTSDKDEWLDDAGAGIDAL